MSRAPFDADALWRLPRVGRPEPAPDGRFCVVPVTRYRPDEAEGVTRLWRVGPEGAPQPLTSEEASASAPALSHDGRMLAFLRKPGAGAKARFADQAQLHVMPLSGGEPRRLTDLPLGAAAPRWLPDGRLVVLGGLLAEAPTVDGTAGLIERRAKDPVKAMVTEDRVYRFWDRWLTDGRMHHPMVVDPDDGSLVDLCPGMNRWLGLMGVDDSYAVAPDGREVAFNACRSEAPFSPLVFSVYTVAVPERGAAGAADVAPPRLLDEGHAGPAGGAAYSPDGRWLVYGIQREVGFYADRQRLVAYDRQAGTRHVLTEDWDVSADDWAFLEGGRLLVSAEQEARKALFELDVAAAALDPELRPRELWRGGWVGGLRVAGGRVFTTHESLIEPPEATVIDPAAARVEVLTSFARPLLAESELGRVEEMRLPGAGGAEVQMWLLSPPEAGDGPLPLVHLVHGGPHGAFGDQWHWRWNPHAFVGAGHRVAMVNFHGSTGFGEAFTRAILGRWGDQPAADILAATDLLVERGLADPDRMALAGGSYGGYLVSWLAGSTDRFRAIVNHAGVSDFQTQYASDVTQGRRRAMGGELWEDLEGLDRYNPIRRAAHFTTPMLVIHGVQDFRVPYNQGLTIYNVYRARGLPARLVVYPDENHWILKPHNSRHWYGEVLAWLGRWLGQPARPPDQEP